MDIPTVATEVTAALVPALPYLVTAGQKGAEVIGEQLASSVWETAKALWHKLRPVVEVSPMATEAVRDLAAAPDDADAQASLRMQLRKLLAADEGLLKGLAEVLQAAGHPQDYRATVIGDGAVAQGPGAVAAGKGGVAVGGDVQGGVRIGGKD